MKNLLALSMAAIFFLNIQSTHADIKTELLICKSIESSVHRLECFDNATKLFVSTSSALAKKPPLVKSIDIIKIKASTSKPMPKKQDPSKFGIETADQDETVESFIIGEFKGWKKGLKLRLKNGQVWKVISSSYGYSKKQDPAITISRGFFGSFNAKIDGLNASAKVKRIK
jgi:hypothetical protein